MKNCLIEILPIIGKDSTGSFNGLTSSNHRISRFLNHIMIKNKIKGICYGANNDPVFDVTDPSSDMAFSIIGNCVPDMGLAGIGTTLPE